tara:strand:- start:241 stop:477 length:237 start_codon:yes stop_codon:yes gene_type:complete
MKNDLFWKVKMSEYTKSYGFFRKNFIAETGIEDEDIIERQWIIFIDYVCDCEGCREDEGSCVIQVSFPIDEDDEDEFS